MLFFYMHTTISLLGISYIVSRHLWKAVSLNCDSTHLFIPMNKTFQFSSPPPRPWWIRTAPLRHYCYRFRHSAIFSKNKCICIILKKYLLSKQSWNFFLSLSGEQWNRTICHKARSTLAGCPYHHQGLLSMIVWLRWDSNPWLSH